MNKNEIYYDLIKTVSIATLQNMYSPMFDKKFNEMTDEEIKAQLDLWVETGENAHIFEPKKKQTSEQRTKAFRKFVGGK